VVAFRLARGGEAPSLWSRTIDRPGGRFLSGAAAALFVLVLIAIGLRRWRRRARLRHSPG
jgi:quinoprotein glucose dehydrogenase